MTRGTYRMNRKKVFLTYPQCGTLTKERVLEHLQGFREVSKYLIAEEVHQDGGRHIHCYVEFASKPDTANVRWADVDGNHPNDGGSVRNDKAVSEYCSKDGNYITNYYTGPTDKEDPFSQALSMDNKKDASEHIKTKRPRDWLIHSDKIEGSLTKHFKSTHEEGGKYTLEDFIIPPLNLTRANLVYGKSGYGKTQFALAHFKNPLLVNHMDRLRTLDPSIHDGVVFDDMDFSHYPAEGIIHLLDMEMSRDIHARYSCAQLPKGFPRIFTSNKKDIFAVAKITDQQKIAITRRIVVTPVINEIRKNPPEQDFNNEIDEGLFRSDIPDYNLYPIGRSHDD